MIKLKTIVIQEYVIIFLNTMLQIVLIYFHIYINSSLFISCMVITILLSYLFIYNLTRLSLGEEYL
jgi:hypothetical protein